MKDKIMAVVKVKSHTRDGGKVSSYMRSSADSSNSKRVGDCSLKGVVGRAVKVYKMSDAKNPAKTGKPVVDFATGCLPLVKDWNKGFNLGKLGFVVQQTYNDTCKCKK